MKFCFIDVETTGTDPKKHGLVQLAGKFVVDGKVVEKFNINAAPFPGDVIEAEALAVTGLTEEIIRAYPNPRESYRAFVRMLGQHCDKFKRSDKFQFVGYYADFDAGQVRSWFEKNNDQYFGSWFWMPVLDVAKLAGVRLMEKRHHMSDFRLLTVAKFLGLEVDPEKAHDADYDIDLTIQIFKQLTQDLGFLDTKLEI